MAKKLMDCISKRDHKEKKFMAQINGRDIKNNPVFNDDEEDRKPAEIDENVAQTIKNILRSKRRL